jgi:putative ATP-binding cassette transporter
MADRITFGELMVVVGAFTQVQSSLRWFVDNFSNLADWRATLLRISSFRHAVLTVDTMGQSASRIELSENGDGIRFDDLHVAAPGGAVTLSQAHVAFRAGERALIVGDRGSGRTLLFQAIVGIWPWGQGRITRPPRGAVMFLPARAYVPPGSLRSALAYPHSTHVLDDKTIGAAFEAVGLAPLAKELDTSERWDRRLNENDKQCLAFARVLLQRPHWLVMDGVLEGMDPASRRRIEGLLKDTLHEVGLISIGEDDDQRLAFSQTLQMVTDPAGVTFEPEKHVAASGNTDHANP